jgi:hypothetical protein
MSNSIRKRTVKIKAPFKVAYDGPFTFRIWGFGLGYVPIPMGHLGFGYNVSGSAAQLPFGQNWKSKKNGEVELL